MTVFFDNPFICLLSINYENRMKYKMLTVIIVAFLQQGCATYKNLSEYPSKPYGGLEIRNSGKGGCYMLDCIGKLISIPFIFIDYPLSAIADTASLPYTIPSYMIYNRNAQHLFGYWESHNENKCFVSLDLKENEEMARQLNYKKTSSVCKYESIGNFRECSEGMWKFKENEIIYRMGNERGRSSSYDEYHLSYDEQSDTLTYQGSRQFHSSGPLQFRSNICNYKVKLHRKLSEN